MAEKDHTLLSGSIYKTLLMVKEELTKSSLRLIVGVSGGIDSHTLLHLLVSLSKELELELIIAHVNHKLRAESDEEEKFVRDLALHYQQESAFFTAHPPEQGANIEAWGREVRYRFFSSLLSERKGDLIVTAHHVNDQAETILMSFLSGRMALRTHRVHFFQRSEKLLRPLLMHSRKEIVHYATRKNLQYVSDASNADCLRTRNRVRHELLPYVEAKFNEDILSTLERIGERLAEDDCFLWGIAQEKIVEAGRVSVPYLQALPSALRWRVLRELCIDEIGPEVNAIGYERFAAIATVLSQGVQRGDVGGGIVFYVDQEKILHFARQEEFLDRFLETIEEILEVPGVVSREYPNGVTGTIRSRIVERTEFRVEEIKKDQTLAYFDFGTLSPGVLKIRERKAGDRISVRNVGTRKLKKIFQEKRIWEPLRNRVPLVEWNGEIIWVPGIFRSGAALVTGESREILELSYEEQHL